MKTKSGETIPRSLESELRDRPRIAAAWAKLRPSCQHDYVERVRSAGDAATRKKRIARILELTRSYGQRHPS